MVNCHWACTFSSFVEEVNITTPCRDGLTFLTLLFLSVCLSLWVIFFFLLCFLKVLVDRTGLRSHLSNNYPIINLFKFVNTCFLDKKRIKYFIVTFCVCDVKKDDTLSWESVKCHEKHFAERVTSSFQKYRRKTWTAWVSVLFCFVSISRLFYQYYMNKLSFYVTLPGT